MGRRNPRVSKAFVNGDKWRSIGRANLHNRPRLTSHLNRPRPRNSVTGAVSKSAPPANERELFANFISISLGIAILNHSIINSRGILQQIIEYLGYLFFHLFFFFFIPFAFPFPRSTPLKLSLPAFSPLWFPIRNVLRFLPHFLANRIQPLQKHKFAI